MTGLDNKIEGNESGLTIEESIMYIMLSVMKSVELSANEDADKFLEQREVNIEPED